MLSYNEITKRKYIDLDGEPYEVISSQVSRKQANKPVNKTKVKSLISGKVIEKVFHVSDKAQEADLDTQKIKYLYENKGEYWFCEEGDFILIHDTGGYTLSLWSRHTSRQIPKVLGYQNDGEQFKILKKRESLEDVYNFWK